MKLAPIGMCFLQKKSRSFSYAANVAQLAR